MTQDETFRLALFDAIEWQQSYADSWSRNAPEADHALQMVAQYKKILKRKFGHDMSKMDKRLEGASYITLSELQKQIEDKKL